MSKDVHQAVKYCQLDTDQCYADAQKSLGFAITMVMEGQKTYQDVNCILAAVKDI